MQLKNILKVLVVPAIVATTLTACDDTPNIVGTYDSVDGNKELYGKVIQPSDDKRIFAFDGRLFCDYEKMGLGKQPRSKDVFFNLKGDKLIKTHSNEEKILGSFDGKNLSIKEGSCQGSFKKVN